MELTKYNKGYKEFDEELKTELSGVANGFVRIGYLLKIARDTTILQESGYPNVVTYAAARFNLDKSQVSRFIAINDKFSEGGYSQQIQTQYAEFGFAKLSLMLNLPNAVNETLTPDLSKTDVQAIKQEIDEEKKITPIELYMEQQEQPEQQDEPMLARAIKSFLRNAPELYAEAFEVVQKTHSARELAEVFCPGECKVDMTRIPGTGRLMISYKGPSKDIEVINIRTEEKETFTWQEMENTMRNLMPVDDMEVAWEQTYKEPYPKKEVAQVQSAKKENWKPEKQKSKVTKAVMQPILHDVEPSIPKPNPIEDTETVEKEPEPVEPEKQIEGQDNIENHKEWMPEPVIDTTYEDITENAEVAPVQQESEKKQILDKLYVLRQKVLNDNKADAEMLTREILEMIGGWNIEKHNPN